MYHSERPETSKQNDLLNRKVFAEHFTQSLIDWKDNDSLVISLNGKWGHGKSTIVNFIKETLSERNLIINQSVLKKNNARKLFDRITRTFTKIGSAQNNPNQSNEFTVIEFNPWLYSDITNLTGQFFSEVAKSIHIFKDPDKDKMLAEKIRLYSTLLGTIPDKAASKEVYDSAIKPNLEWWCMVLGVAGFSANTFTTLPDNVKYFIAGICGLLALSVLIKGLIANIARYFDQRAKIHTKTASTIKQEIELALLNGKIKLLIIIDDIDRLTKSEIRLMMQLVRINANFSNTIYLLPFDNKIVEASLDEPPGTSGREYLQKIIQVQYDIPPHSSEIVLSFLLKELSAIDESLPETNGITSQEHYWINVFHSGYKHFFKNLRDVKRYLNSLRFAVSYVNRTGVIEVNPIDLFAIEAIRVFAPSMYIFIKENKDLFLHPTREQKDALQKREFYKNGLESVDKGIREAVDDLVQRIFPEIRNLHKDQRSTFGENYYIESAKNLQIHSAKHFDAYFTLNVEQGGAVSNYHVHSLLGNVGDQERVESILKEHIKNGSYRALIDRFKPHWLNKKSSPIHEVKSLGQAIINIYDILPKDSSGFFDFEDSKTSSYQILFHALKSIEQTDQRLKIIENWISRSKGILAPLRLISGLDKNRSDYEDMIPHGSDIGNLKRICVEKIEDKYQKKELLQIEGTDFISMLHYWKLWGEESSCLEFIDSVFSDCENLVEFLKHFIGVGHSLTLGEFAQRKRTTYMLDELSKLTPLCKVMESLAAFKETDSDCYNKNKEIIDGYLKNIPLAQNTNSEDHPHDFGDDVL